jgi:hypothetical protein
MAVLFRGNLRWVILLVGVAGLLTAPSLGVRKCRCYAYPDWAGIFLYTGEDGSVECRSVYSEFAAFGDGRVPADDPDLAYEIELMLVEGCAVYLHRPFLPTEAGGVFFDWRWTRRVWLPGDSLASAGTDAAAARAALRTFVETASPGREDITGRRPAPGDHTLLLAALSSPTGAATRYDTLALLREIAAWLVCLGVAVACMWGTVRMRRATLQLRRIARGDCCWSCGYSREGLVEAAVCPECGRPAVRPSGFEGTAGADALVLLGPESGRGMTRALEAKYEGSPF